MATRDPVPPPASLGDAWPDAPVRVVTWPPGLDRRDLVRSLLAAEGSSLVLVPEPARAMPLVRALGRAGGAVLHHHGDLANRDRVALWQRARRGGAVVVGGRAAVWLPLPDLRSIVVLDERDEAFQEERAPTWHARDVALERARRGAAVVTLVSPAPSLEAVAVEGAVLIAPSPRVLRGGWPRLDVVDLRLEPPGARVCSSALGAALRLAIDDGGRAVCVVNRRGRAQLLACRACEALARCAHCGATVGQPDHRFQCARCGTSRPPVCAECGSSRVRALRPGVRAVRDEVAGLVPRIGVAEVDATTDLDDPVVRAAPVLVGTEAVLHRLRGGPMPRVRLVAFLLFDEELLAPRFRAHEQALWLLVRAARLLGPRGEGGRLLVQTRAPHHPVLRVAASGDPAPFTREEASLRSALRYPPFGGLAEVSGERAAVVAAVTALRDAGLTVLGGTEGPALVRADSARDLAEGLAQVDLAPARARGRLRVSVDPPRV